MGKRIIYIYACRQCRTQFMMLNSSRRQLINVCFYDEKVSPIDKASVTIILCLHVLIAHRIFIYFGYADFFSEYRCLKR